MEQIELSACPTKVLIAVKGAAAPTGAPMIVVGFGADLADGDFYAIDVSDARRLRRLLGQALADPTPVARPCRR